MKKVLAWVLLVVLCLGLFAGCKKNNETPNTTAPAPTTGENVDATADLEAALEYIKTVYRKPSEKTPKDFTRIGNVPVNGKNYEVVWTADVGEEFIKVVKGADGMVTIDVNENVEAETKYVLTATISDGDKSVSHSWNHLIPTAGNMLSIVEDAYKLEPGASMDYEVTLTGKIISIDTPWDAGYKNITVTIAVEGAEDKPIMCYRLKGEGADTLKPNDIITVTGKLKNYNGTIEFDAGCTLDKLVVGEEIKAPEDPKQIIKEAFELAEGGALPYQATLSGVISKVNTEFNPQYNNVTVTITLDADKSKSIQCYRLAGSGAEKIGKGDTITVTGWIANYKGTVQFGAGCTLDSWKDTGKNEPKPEDTFTTTLVPEVVTKPQAGVAYKFFMYQKSFEKNFYLSGEMDGFYYATTYDPAKAVDVFVEEVSGGYRLYFVKGGTKNYLEVLRQFSDSTGKYHNNVVFSTKPTTVFKWNDAIKSFTTTVNVDGVNTDFYLGTYSFYKTFSASDVSRITGDDAGKMDTENFVARLATMKETKVSEEEKAYEQLKTDYPPTSAATATTEDYTRKNVYEVEGKKVKVEWTVDNAAVTVVDNGDGTVTVKVVRGEADVAYKLTATITNGKEKLTSSWDCVVPAVPKTAPKDIVNAAYALEPGAAMADPVTLTGMILSIDSAYSEAYGNITVTIMVEDMFDKQIQCFRLKGEGAANLQVFDTITVTGILKNYNGTIEFDAGCTLDACKTQTQIVEEAYALEAGAALEQGYTLIGTVVSVDTAYNEQYGNVTVTIAVPGCEDKTIQCFRLKGEGAAELAVDYTVAVFGKLKNYNGTIEFDAGCVLVDYAAPEDPDATIPELTIPDANALGAAQADNVYTEEVYAVTGTVSKIVNATYGNVYITDAAGNKFYIYGLYDAEGNRFDAMPVQPKVGDVLTVVGGLGQYKGAAQMKNGAILAHVQVLTIPAANELGAGLTTDSESKYLVTGVVTEIANATYGNIYIEDAEGNKLYVYGLYNVDGSVRFDAMELQPKVGDIVTVYGVMSQYKGNPQMKNAWLADHMVVATLADANTIGAAVANNETTAIKYLVTGTVTEIVNATYGNIYITDEEGNKFYIYGLYDAIGNLRFDAMPLQPKVGDTVAVYGVLCQYKGAAQMKNGWMLGLAVAETETPEEPEAPAEPEILEVTIPAANEIGAAQADNVYTEQKYQVTGFVTEVKNATYGNVYIQDADGNQLYVYGLYDAEGNRYDKMAIQPKVGDLITVVGGMGQYKGAAQMKNATFTAYTQALTIPAANELGAGLTTDSEAKYLVTGVVTEIKNATYGNVYIEDAEGNKLYVYGLYNADGTVRFDKMEVQPKVGDTITVCGVMSQYKGDPQMKNGWVLIHAVSETEA